MSSEKIRAAVWFLAAAIIVVLALYIFKGERLVVRDSETYQAVFLSNNQVYFGKLKSVNRDLWRLTDVYYLRAGTVQSASSEIDLIKLGGELHAPTDEMFINKSHVIFYEAISETGEVMRLIRKHQGK